MQEREISLNLLFWKMVREWRVWVVASVIGAVLVPLLQYGTAMAGYRSDLQTYEAAVSQDGKDRTFSFTQEEQLQIEDASRVKMLLAKNRDYAANAVLMNIDPYQEQVLTLTYCVDTHYVANYIEGVEQNYTDTLIAALSTYASNGLDQTQVWGEDEDLIARKHLGELITTYVPSTGKSFSVLVAYSDEETLHTVAENIKPLMENKAQELAKSITDFELTLVSEDYQVRENYDLAVKQQDVQNAIINYNTTLTTLTAKMTEEQLNYLELDDPEEGGDGGDVMETPVKPSFSLKYVLLGTLVGAFFAVFVLAFLYMSSVKLHSTEELVEIFRLRLFGRIHLSVEKNGIDGLIDKLKNSRRKQLTTDKAIHLAVSNVALYCKKEKISQLYLTGTEIEKLTKDVIERISADFRENGIRIIYGENIYYDAVSLKNAVETGAVLLMEQEEVALVPEIEQEIRILQDQAVNIVGCIGVE